MCARSELSRGTFLGAESHENSLDYLVAPDNHPDQDECRGDGRQHPFAQSAKCEIKKSWTGGSMALSASLTTCTIYSVSSAQLTYTACYMECIVRKGLARYDHVNILIFTDPIQIQED